MVRQGDPLSGSLFVIAVELLANSLRTNKNINGISVPKKQILLTQYADDTTIIVKAVQVTKETFRIIHLLSEVSGLILNKNKCERMWLGSIKRRGTQLCDISWPKRPITAQGARSVSYDQEQNDNRNFHEKLMQLEKKSLKTCEGRGLTTIGKICILQMLGISKLLYACSNLKVLETFPKIVNSCTTNFVWKSLPLKSKVQQWYKIQNKRRAKNARYVYNV